MNDSEGQNLHKSATSKTAINKSMVLCKKCKTSFPLERAIASWNGNKLEMVCPNCEKVLEK